MFHDDNDLLDACYQIHGTAHTLDHFARHHPIGDIATFGDLHAAKHGQIDMPAPDHRKAGGTIEIGRLRKLADRLFTGIDQVWIFLACIGKGADAEQAVFGLQRHFNAIGNMIGNERGDANAQIDIIAILQLARRPGGHVVTCPGHYAASLSRTVRNSIFLSYGAPMITRCT